MINKEFLTWFVEQECYPFTQGWMLKQSLWGDIEDYVGKINIKQALMKNKNVSKFIYDWVIKEWYKTDKFIVFREENDKVKKYMRLWKTKI